MNELPYLNRQLGVNSILQEKQERGNRNGDNIDKKFEKEICF